MKIIVNKDKCTACGICVAVCPQKVLEIREEKSYCFDIERCMGCFGCEDECPSNAIRVLRAPQYIKEIEIEAPLDIDECDVAIVGAGPSGLGAAITCAKAGLNVVVFERLPNRKISHHTDGGVLFEMPGMSSIKTGEKRISFPELDISVSSDFAKRCTAFGLIGPDGVSTKNKFPGNIKGYTGNKDMFIHNLIDEAEQAGARIWFNAKVVDVIKDDDQVSGVVLESGKTIKAKVSVLADGVMAKISHKAGMKINRENLWHANILAYEWENTEELPTELFYINGDMKYDSNIPVIFGAVSVTNVVHVLVATLSRKKFRPSDKPLDYYLEKIKKDKRVVDIIGNDILNKKPKMLNGCRGVFRDKPNKDTALAGAVSVGDAWVDDGELSNVGALTHGVYAGRVIIEAFEKNDFSKQALEPVNEFITDKLIKMLDKNKQMKLIETVFSEKEFRQMFQIMQHANYPIMLLGKPGQQAAMFTGFMLKNIINLFRYSKVFKKIM